MNEQAVLAEQADEGVPRPSGKFGVVGLILGILGVIVPGLSLIALPISWVGFRSRRVVCAVLGYAFGWIGCVFWAWVLVSYLMFSAAISGGFMLADDVLDPLEGAVLSIRVYQTEHDGALPDDETGTKILTAAVKPYVTNELAGLFGVIDSKELKGAGPASDWFKLAYTRGTQETWKAEMIFSESFLERFKARKGNASTVYEFDASGKVIGANSGY